MTRWTAVLAFALAVLALGGAAAAEDPQPDPLPAPAKEARGFDPFVVGAHASLGIAWQFFDTGELPYDEPPDWKPRFAGGGGAYFDLYLAELFALEAGVGFIGKGDRWEGHNLEGHDVALWNRIIYMEIPLGAKLNIQGFQASVTLGLEFALSGKSVTEYGGQKTTHTWTEGPDYEGEPGEWDFYRRFNLCPRITLGYAIPVGPVAIVPGVTWMIEVINTMKDELADDYHAKAHNMNLMFNLGLEYGFGGGK